MATLTPFFKDTTGTAEGLLSFGYVGVSSFKFSTLTDIQGNAVSQTLRTTSGKSLVLNTKTDKWEEKMVSTVEPCFEDRATGSRLNTILATDGEFGVDAIFNNPLIPLSTLGATNSLSPFFTFQNPNTAFKTVMSVSDALPSTVSADLNIQPFTNFFIGGSIAAKVKQTGSVLQRSEVKGTVAWPTSKFSVFSRYDKCLVPGASRGQLTKKIGYDWWYSPAAHLAFGSKALCDLSFPSNTGPTVTFGGNYKVDPDLSFSAKTQVSFNVSENEGAAPAKQPEVRLILAARTSISPTVTATVGADINGNHVFGSPLYRPHSFGIELAVRHDIRYPPPVPVQAVTVLPAETKKDK